MDALTTTLTVLDYAAVAVFAASGGLVVAGVIGFASAFMVRAGTILFGWQTPLNRHPTVDRQQQTIPVSATGEDRGPQRRASADYPHAAPPGELPRASPGVPVFGCGETGIDNRWGDYRRGGSTTPTRSGCGGGNAIISR